MDQYALGREAAAGLYRAHAVPYVYGRLDQEGILTPLAVVVFYHEGIGGLA